MEELAEQVGKECGRMMEVVQHSPEEMAECPSAGGTAHRGCKDEAEQIADNEGLPLLPGGL